jgi:hypothetical protein
MKPKNVLPTWHEPPSPGLYSKPDDSFYILTTFN